MRIRYVALFLVLFLIWIQSVTGQTNNPIIRTKVIQGKSVNDISLFSLNPISTINAFSENMSGEGLNRDAVDGTMYHLRYDADVNFEGIDVAIFETSESLFGPKSFVTVEIEVVKSIIDAKDDFGLIGVSEELILNVVQNDVHSENEISIHSIESAYGGSFEIIDASSIEFLPEEGFEGLASASYIVIDSKGTTGIAHVFIQVTSGKLIESEELSYLHVVSEPLLINIESAGYSLSTETQLLFGELTQIGPFSFRYEATLFTEGIESFSLVNDNGDTKTVEISLVKTIDNQSVLKDDVAYTVPGKYVVIDALANDYRNNGVIVDYSEGLLYASGIFAYIPDEQFEGVKEFYYSVNDGFKTHTASILVYVGNYLPRVTDYEFQVYQNTPLALEYNVPITAYDFNIISEPTSGSLEVNSNEIIRICANSIGDKMVVYTPDSDFIGIDEFVIEYCSEAGVCEKIDVALNVISYSDNCACVGLDCVWPGDTNHDGVVNVGDLLPIGLNYGLSGESREDSGNWGAQNTTDWNREQLDESNVNHVDANGDGIVSVTDTEAILENYSNQDNLIPDATLLDKSIPVRLVPSDPNPSNGDLLSIEVFVGSVEYPVVDLHGLAMSVEIPNSLLSDSTSLVFVPNREWFGNNSPVISMYFNGPGGQVDFSVARTDNVGISGSGSIGTLNTVVRIDIDELRPDGPEIPIKMKSPKSYMMDGRGTPIQINGAELEIKVQLGNEDQLNQNIISDDIDVLISPNPSVGPITIHANNNDELREVVIYDLIGQKMVEQTGLQSNQLVITQALSQGLYLAHIKTLKGYTVQQLEVLR